MFRGPRSFLSLDCGCAALEISGWLPSFYSDDFPKLLDTIGRFRIRLLLFFRCQSLPEHAGGETANKFPVFDIHPVSKIVEIKEVAEEAEGGPLSSIAG